MKPLQPPMEQRTFMHLSSEYYDAEKNKAFQMTPLRTHDCCSFITFRRNVFSSSPLVLIQFHGRNPIHIGLDQLSVNICLLYRDQIKN
jgi:hypothetical protein